MDESSQSSTHDVLAGSGEASSKWSLELRSTSSSCSSSPGENDSDSMLDLKAVLLLVIHSPEVMPTPRI